MRALHCTGVGLALLLISVVAEAQTRYGIALGATWVHFESQAGGTFGAVGAEMRVARPIHRNNDIAVEAFMVAPLGAANVVPDCVPGAACIERRTPDLILGALVSYAVPLRSGITTSLGAGAVAVTGSRGASKRSAVAGSLGLKWSPGTTSLAPTLSLRATALESPVAGLRYLILPAIGVAF